MDCVAIGCKSRMGVLTENNQRLSFHRNPRESSCIMNGSPRNPLHAQRPLHFIHYEPQGFYLRPPSWRSPGPINMNYWCETCDRGFPSVKTLDNHKTQHKKCNIDGCEFIAHPKVITKHIQMQHSSGLFQKIANLNNLEEIQKWREERKKKYPTKENIEKKAAEIKEKMERGEKMGLKQVKSKRDYTNRGWGQKRQGQLDNYNYSKLKMTKFSESTHTIKNISHSDRKQFSMKKFEDLNKKKGLEKHTINKTLPQIEDRRKLRPFAGIQYLTLDESDNQMAQEVANDLIEDDGNLVEPEALESTLDETRKEPSVCGALSQLMYQYESSDESISNENVTSLTNEIQINGKRAQIEANQKTSLAKEKHKVTKGTASNGDIGPEEVKVVKADKSSDHNSPETYDKIQNNNSRRTNKNNIRTIVNHRPYPKMPSTLLQKLLHREIQHERNVVLQCIRYIVKNDHFDKH